MWERGWALEIETFLVPVEWHWAVRGVQFGRKKSRFPGPNPLPLAQICQHQKHYVQGCINQRFTGSFMYMSVCILYAVFYILYSLFCILYLFFTLSIHEFCIYIFFGGIFYIFLYYIQHCFICRPSDSALPTDTGIEPRTIETGALTVRRSNH